MANFLFQDKSLLIFGVSTLSMYLFLKGLYRVFETGKQGVLKLIIYPIKSVPGTCFFLPFLPSIYIFSA